MNVASLIGGLRNPATTNRKIFRAAATVGVFSTGVKLISMFKEVSVAAYFGRGDAVDAFLIAFILPSFIVSLISLQLNAALVPTFIEVRDREGHDSAQQLLSTTMLWSQLLLIALTFALAAFGPMLVHVLAPSFPAAKLSLCVHLLYAMLPLIVLSGASTTCAAVLNASGCFWGPAVSPVFIPGATLVLLLTGGRAWGGWALAVGAVIGAASETAFLMMLLHREGMHIKACAGIDTPAARQVRAQYIPMLASGLLTSAVTVVDQGMASWLQPGSVAALVYGNRIVSVVVGLSATSLTAAVIPYFSEMVNAQRWEECRQTLRTYTRVLITIMTPVAAAIILFSPTIVRLLYQRGAFTPQDTVTVSRVQGMYALQIPFYAAGLLYVRLLTAMKRNDLVMISSGINLGLDVVLNIVCMKWMGVAGIALSTSLFYVGSLTFAVYMGRKLLREADHTPATHLVIGEEACV